MRAENQRIPETVFRVFVVALRSGYSLGCGICGSYGKREPT